MIDGTYLIRDLIEKEILAVTKVMPIRVLLSRYFKEDKVN